MCKAHTLRFSCTHGLLMGIEPCKLGPCPVIKVSADRLPQQPYRCYNCQRKKEARNSRPATASPLSRTTSCAPGATIFDTEGMDAATTAATSPFRRVQSFPTVTPPSFLSRQQSNTLQRQPSNQKSFKFTCQQHPSKHALPSHYFGLPPHLPHQDHVCPPCQLQTLREKGEADAVRAARNEYPSLTEEMLIRGGCIKEWQSKPTWEAYVDEKVTEEREMWYFVTRKWTQDLKRLRVLVAEEDGLGLHYLGDD